MDTLTELTTAAPLTEFASLVAGLRERPLDSAPLSVCSDWLLEHDRPLLAAAMSRCAAQSAADWVAVWRQGFLPELTRSDLMALALALATDDPTLTQGATTTPPPLQAVQDWPIEAADALAYMGWKGRNLNTVGEAEEFFARLCFEADQRLGEAAACRYFLNFWDNAPRPELFPALLAEVWRGLLLLQHAEMPRE